MNEQEREAMKQALEALIEVTGWTWAGPMRVMDEVEDAITALRQAIAEAKKQEPVSWMRMPKVGDRVVCIEDEDLGTVEYLTAGGGHVIKFDDGSHGTYLLREFAELFRYAEPRTQPQNEEGLL